MNRRLNPRKRPELGWPMAEVPFALSEIVVIEHKRRDEVAVLIKILIGVVVLPCTMDLKQGVEIHLFEVRNSGGVIQIGNGGEEFSVNHMKLWRYMTCLHILNATDATGMTTRDAKVLALAGAGNPFWELLLILKGRVHDIAWATEHMKASQVGIVSH
jgi:hypothetical protein